MSVDMRVVRTIMTKVSVVMLCSALQLMIWRPHEQDVGGDDEVGGKGGVHCPDKEEEKVILGVGDDIVVN
eukprot:15366896-Ditylum_brightwellii.AAC.1